MINVIKDEVQHPHNYERGFSPTKTVPDMSEPLDVLLKRFTRGGDVKQFRPVYNGDTELPNVKSMDLTEVDEYSRNLKNQVQNGKKEKASLEQQIEKRNAKQKADQMQTVIPQPTV